MLRRICTYSFRGRHIYVETLLDSGVNTLQIKDWWESNYFQNRIIMFRLPISTCMYPWAIYTYIPRIHLLILLQPNRQTDPGNIEIAHWYMKVGIGTEAVQFFLGIHKSDFQYSAKCSECTFSVTHKKISVIPNTLFPPSFYRPSADCSQPYILTILVTFWDD